MKRKFILCPFRNGYFCLLITCIILNSAYGWTAQNSVINSKNFVQRISFELLHRVYKTPKFLGYVLYECPSIILEFIHPLLSKFVWIPLWWPFSQKRAYVFFYPSVTKTPDGNCSVLFTTWEKVFRWLSSFLTVS